MTRSQQQRIEALTWLDFGTVTRDLDLSICVPGVAQIAYTMKWQSTDPHPFDAEWLSPVSRRKAIRTGHRGGPLVLSCSLFARGEDSVFSQDTVDVDVGRLGRPAQGFLLVGSVLATRLRYWDIKERFELFMFASCGGKNARTEGLGPL